MPGIHHISADPLTIDAIHEAIDGGKKLKLSRDAIARIESCSQYLAKRVSSTFDPIYGINTGFGSLYNKHIEHEDLEKLQVNLVKSHACGTGDRIPDDIVRLMLFLKIQSLSYGHSGVQTETVQRLIDFYNNQVYPVVYEYGSLGASGDLAPLAHLSLPLIGDGEVSYKGKIVSAEEINSRFGWSPIHLKAKEGLALLNGTQFMTAYGVWCLIQASRLSKLSNIIGSLSVDVFDGRQEPFDERVNMIRPQEGQKVVAEEVRKLLEGSELIARPKDHVQDPYSFRCIPQVHGASYDAIKFSTDIVTREINGVSDNPNIFPDDDKIISAGNFHGQAIAFSLDFLCLALAELGSISERRIYQLLSGQRRLPNYLVANPGINSGLMIPHYTAASLVSKNKELCVPSSADSIVTSNGQEDHVSMGANAALKAWKVVNNLFSILSIELITASQALEFRRPAKTSPYLENLVAEFRLHVSFIEEDRVLHEDIRAAENFVKTMKV